MNALTRISRQHGNNVIRIVILGTIFTVLFQFIFVLSTLSRLLVYKYLHNGETKALGEREKNVFTGG